MNHKAIIQVKLVKNFIIIISGPTACGKTGLAECVAKQVIGEIINADIGSFYKPLTIGTAKPDWKNSKINHHLFDILDEPQHFSVVQFRRTVQALLIQIWNRGKIPVIVGGSTMYIKALLFDIHQLPDTKFIVQHLTHQIETQKIDSIQLWQKLYDQDPVRAVKIHKNDRYRIVQAMAILQATGQNPSKFEQFFSPIAPFYWISCTRNRQELYERIDQRVLEMLSQGWIDEVESLKKTDWQSFLIAKKIIGYDDIFQYLNGVLDKASLKVIIQQKTRNYAKRQITFFKKLQSDTKRVLADSNFSGCIGDLDLTLCDVELYIKGLLQEILQNLK